MAASRQILLEKISDVTECAICTEVMANPKVLPCIHTFCLKCLDQFWKNKLPGDKVPCPLCRTEFTIPDGGFVNLPNNFYIEKLLDVDKLSKEKVSRIIACEICSKLNNENETSEVTPTGATKYCVECQQNICDQCSRLHLLMNALKSHQVLPIGTQPKVEYLLSFSGNFCNQHPEKKIEIYCLECKSAVCTTCFIIKHKKHGCADIMEVVEELKKQIKDDIDKIDKIAVDTKIQTDKFEEQFKSYEEKIEKIESDILERGEEIKKLVDIHVQSLLQKLNSEKSKNLKVCENIREDLQRQKTIFETFKRYSEEVLNRAVPSDIARVANDLNTRANELKNLKMVDIGKEIEVSFLPSDLHIYTAENAERNMVGRIITKASLEPFNYEIQPRLTTTIPFTHNVTGVTVLGKEIFVSMLSSSEIKIFDRDTFSANQTSISVNGLSNPWDMIGHDNVLFVSERTNKLIHRVQLPEKSVTCWSVNSTNPGLSTTQQGNVLVACHDIKKLIEYTSTGNLLREIGLQQDMDNPYHAILLDNDQFLVCHSGSSHRVCLINNTGQLIKSYGGAFGSQVGQLNNPINLIVDPCGFIFICDHRNNRVVLLNSKLEFVKELIPPSMGLQTPIRMFLDDMNGNLYVGDYGGKKLSVFKLFS